MYNVYRRELYDVCILADNDTITIQCHVYVYRRELYDMCVLADNDTTTIGRHVCNV